MSTFDPADPDPVYQRHVPWWRRTPLRTYLSTLAGVLFVLLITFVVLYLLG